MTASSTTSTRDAVRELAGEGASASRDLEDLVAQLDKPRAVWVMLPAGEVTERTVLQLAELLAPGDIVIDGGNSYYKDDIRRAQELKPKGLHYVDVGTTGGVWGLERGYCMMIGGDKEAVDHLDPIFDTLAPGPGDIPRTPNREGRDPRPEQGYLYAGPTGAGHFVKMVHNGIEYGLMQAYAEGFDILKNAGSEDAARRATDGAGPARHRRGLAARQRHLVLAARSRRAGLAQDDELSDFTGYVQDSGEGRWTMLAAIEEAVPADVLSAALYARFRSRGGDHTFGEKLLSAMRKGFGGHRRAQARRLRWSATISRRHACALVIFGATGDLTRRLLLPALYNLLRADAAAGTVRRDRVARDDQDARELPRAHSASASWRSPPTR